MLISCRTSSYFSSIDKRVLRASHAASAAITLCQFVDALCQVAFLVEQQVDPIAVMGGPQILQPVDLPLNGRPLTFPSQPFQQSRAIDQPGDRGRLLPGNTRD